MIHAEEEDVVVAPGMEVEDRAVIIRIILPKGNLVQKHWHKTSSRKHKHDYKHQFINISNKNMSLHLKRKS
jgi:hypothetical protein